MCVCVCVCARITFICCFRVSHKWHCMGMGMGRAVDESANGATWTKESKRDANMNGEWLKWKYLFKRHLFIQIQTLILTWLSIFCVCFHLFIFLSSEIVLYFYLWILLLLLSGIVVAQLLDLRFTNSVFTVTNETSAERKKRIRNS